MLRLGAANARCLCSRPTIISYERIWGDLEVYLPGAGFRFIGSIIMNETTTMKINETRVALVMTQSMDLDSLPTSVKVQ